jgi:hypothetical protein
MKRFVFFISIALVLTCTVLGQTGGLPKDYEARVVLTGAVYDPNGAVIVLGDVMARSLAGKEYQAATNTEGIYKIELPLDVYKIEVNAPGFCPKRVEMFRVRKSTLLQRPLDFVLEISQGDRPCKQQTMIKKQPTIRKPEIFRSIAE